MALSNWDTLMIDQDRKPLGGMWKSDSGIGVELYKNWIHVHDEKAYIGDRAHYSKPIIMMIEEGIICYKDIQIIALRGPQNGVYLVTWKHYYSKDYKKHWIKGAIGCGVYGFSGNRYVGVTKGAIRWFTKELKREEVHYDTLWSSDTRKEKKIKRHHAIYDAPDIFKNMNLIKVQRYNQGDAYIAAHINTPLQNTTPGKAKSTVMSKMTKG